MSIRRALLSASGTTITHVTDCHDNLQWPVNSITVPDDAEPGWSWNGETATPAAWPNLAQYAPVRLIGMNTSIDAGNTIASNAAETSFASTITIPANALSAPCLVDIFASGVYSTLTTPTMILRLKFDSSNFLVTPTISLPSSIANRGWSMSARLIVIATGVDVQGTCEFGTGNVTNIRSVLSNTTTNNADLGVQHVLSVSAKWSVSQPTNSIQMRQFAAFRQG